MTKYIPLEEAKALLKSRRFNSETKEGGLVLALSPTVIDELDSLKTIAPIATIDEMIEDRNETERRGLYLSDNEDWARSVLQELKSRLSLTQK